MNVAEVRGLLERHGLRPRRDLGQNFLVNEAVAEQLVERAGVAAGDAVIEIGPGLGILTRALARRARAVVALEIDAGLVRALRAEGALPAHVELRHADALDVDLAALAGELGSPVRVVANLPYAASSPLLRTLLAARARLVGWAVLVQREVARRIAAGPGDPDYGSLAALHRLAVRVERTGDLRPGCFHPPPRIVSTGLRMEPRPDSPLRVDAEGDELDRVERLLRAAFGTRRKRLANALAAAGWGEPARIDAVLERLGLDPRVRAEALDPETLLELSRALEAT